MPKKKRRTPAQIRATKKLIRLNKARAKGKTSTRKKPRTAKQKAATRKLVALNKRRARGSGGTKKGQTRKTARKAYKPKKKTKGSGRHPRYTPTDTGGSGRRTSTKAIYVVGGKRHRTPLTPNQARTLAKKKGVKAKRAKNQKPVRGSGASTRSRKGSGAGVAIGAAAAIGVGGLLLGLATKK